MKKEISPKSNLKLCTGQGLWFGSEQTHWCTQWGNFWHKGLPKSSAIWKRHKKFKIIFHSKVFLMWWSRSDFPNHYKTSNKSPIFDWKIILKHFLVLSESYSPKETLMLQIYLIVCIHVFAPDYPPMPVYACLCSLVLKVWDFEWRHGRFFSASNSILHISTFSKRILASLEHFFYLKNQLFKCGYLAT